MIDRFTTRATPASRPARDPLPAREPRGPSFAGALRGARQRPATPAAERAEERAPIARATPERGALRDETVTSAQQLVRAQEARTRALRTDRATAPASQPVRDEGATETNALPALDDASVRLPDGEETWRPIARLDEGEPSMPAPLDTQAPIVPDDVASPIATLAADDAAVPAGDERPIAPAPGEVTALPAPVLVAAPLAPPATDAAPIARLDDGADADTGDDTSADAIDGAIPRDGDDDAPTIAVAATSRDTTIALPIGAAAMPRLPLAESAQPAPLGGPQLARPIVPADDAPPELTSLPAVPGDAETAPAGDARPVRTSGVRRSGVVRDLAALDPEFRAKLERVIARMEREHGHDVTVTETFRPQARQEQLYAQGRTTEGAVVTWTRSSKHTKGLAADLLIDGTYDNATGYARLARIATEEGLRTLGPRDPGHVELPGTGAGVAGDASLAAVDELLSRAVREDGASYARVARGAEPRAPQQPDALARIADVAQVARIAKPADVARVAEVAEPGRASSQHAASHEMLPPPVAPIAAVTDTHSAQTHVHAVRTAGGAEAMERVTKLLDLQATQGARPLQNVLLRMGRDGGTEDLLRIGMRGTSVDASLGIGDPLRAAELGGRVSELRAALERRGLGADGVQVQATRGVDRAEWSGAVAPALDIGALRAAGEAALAQQQGGRDAEAQRRQFQQDQQPGAASRDDRKPTNRAHDDDARRQPRRSPQEQPK